MHPAGWPDSHAEALPCEDPEAGERRCSRPAVCSRAAGSPVCQPQASCPDCCVEGEQQHHPHHLHPFIRLASSMQAICSKHTEETSICELHRIRALGSSCTYSLLHGCCIAAVLLQVASIGQDHGCKLHTIGVHIHLTDFAVTGSDPSTHLQRLAQDEGFGAKLHMISLGQGQGPLAQAVIDLAAKQGGHQPHVLPAMCFSLMLGVITLSWLSRRRVCISRLCCLHYASAAWLDLMCHWPDCHAGGSQLVSAFYYLHPASAAWVCCRAVGMPTEMLRACMHDCTCIAQE